MENIEDKKILIIDDDNFLLDMYAMKFKKEGFEVVAVSDAEVALVKLKDESITPKIVLFDLIMPKMDGLTFLKELHNQKIADKFVKIILSNQGQQTDVDTANKIGVDGYIVKALHTPSEVVKSVIEIFNNKNIKK
jgi:two-component system, chemotaxis family, chemotaxis protein CheY